MPTAIHLFTIGKIEAAVIADDYELLPPERFDGIFNRPEDTAIRAAFRHLSAPQFSFNCLYLHTPARYDQPPRHILIDTGEGLHPPRPHGHMLEGLRQLGVTPDQIDTLILTHFHIDHFGGLTDEAGALVFPNAQLVVPKREWEHWMRDAVLGKMDDYRRQTLLQGITPYADANHLDKLSDSNEIAPGIHLVALPGHTPGHSGVSITSGDARLLHIADAAHLPLQLDHLDSIPRFDADPTAATATRRAVIERAVDEGLLIAAFHFPFPGLGTISRADDRFSWHPGPVPVPGIHTAAPAFRS